MPTKVKTCNGKLLFSLFRMFLAFFASCRCYYFHFHSLLIITTTTTCSYFGVFSSIFCYAKSSLIAQAVETIVCYCQVFIFILKCLAIFFYFVVGCKELKLARKFTLSSVEANKAKNKLHFSNLLLSVFDWGVMKAGNIVWIFETASFEATQEIKLIKYVSYLDLFEI